MVKLLEQVEQLNHETGDAGTLQGPSYDGPDNRFLRQSKPVREQAGLFTLPPALLGI